MLFDKSNQKIRVTFGSALHPEAEKLTLDFFTVSSVNPDGSSDQHVVQSYSYNSKEMSFEFTVNFLKDLINSQIKITLRDGSRLRQVEEKDEILRDYVFRPSISSSQKFSYSASSSSTGEAVGQKVGQSA